MRKQMRGCCQNSVATSAPNICLVVNDLSASMLCKEFAAYSQVKDAGRCQYEVEDETPSQAGSVISLFAVSRLAKHYRIRTTIPISQSIPICSQSLWAIFSNVIEFGRAGRHVRVLSLLDFVRMIQTNL